MTLNLISRDTVKTQLGISTTDYDEQIDAMIPIVSADVRKILNKQYDKCASAFYTAGNDSIDLYNPASGGYKKTYQTEIVDIKLGDVVHGDGIPADTYIQSQNPNTGVYTMSASATGTGDYIYPTVNIAQWPTISRMIFYRISKQTTLKIDADNVQSKNLLGMSVNFGNSQINKRWNYPQVMIDDLGFRNAEVG